METEPVPGPGRPGPPCGSRTAGSCTFTGNIRHDTPQLLTLLDAVPLKTHRVLRTPHAVALSGYLRAMWYFRLPGVYAPQEDTAVLLEAFSRERLARDATVLDVGTGSGVLAVAAALRRASVVAVDASRRAVLTARLNAQLAGVPGRIRVLRGDLLAPVPGGCFDLVLANPPYVPTPDGRGRLRGSRRTWAGGPDGRAVLDRLCEGVPEVLRPGAVVLIVHSALCGPERTIKVLEKGGLSAEVTAQRVVVFGPVMRRQAARMREHGLIGSGEWREELVVVRGEYPA